MHADATKVHLQVLFSGIIWKNIDPNFYFCSGLVNKSFLDRSAHAVRNKVPKNGKRQEKKRTRKWGGWQSPTDLSAENGFGF